ncbi:MAG: DegT/DnrJ/EryC1/StrS family aminotransferase [Syntrophaceae bacterium]
MGRLEKEYVSQVLDSNYLNEGDVTARFEQKLADFLGVRHCVAVTSGTAALTLALMALGIGQGDEVIVPDFTFIATANAVRLAGADVKLVDIEPARFTMDAEKVLQAIGRRTKAILAVDVNGRGASYEDLETIAAQKGLYLLCDSAEALGSRYRDRYLGTFGDAGCFSFSANKTITTGQGGLIATADTEVYHRLLELKDQGRRTRGTGGDDLHPVMGYNFKFTNLQAAVGLAQLEKLRERLDHARWREERYIQRLGNQPRWGLPSRNNQEGEVTQWTDLLADDRKSIEAAFRQAGIGYRCFWHPLHRQGPYAADDADFATSIETSQKGLWLPSSFSLTEEQVDRTAEVLRRLPGHA